jgi:hypothetical protein
MIQKGKWQPKKIKWYRDMTKSVTQYSHFGYQFQKFAGFCSDKTEFNEE